MPHQRLVPSRNPKIVLTEILSQVSDLRHSLLERSCETHKARLEISVSNVERDRGQLHQALGVQERVAFTIGVFSVAGAGRNL